MARRRRRRKQLAQRSSPRPGQALPRQPRPNRHGPLRPAEMVQIWNDGSLPVQTYRLSSSGEEIKHKPISKGAAILAEGCSNTVWRARLDAGRLVDEFTQGSSSAPVETSAVSISASSLSEEVASERWRIQDCQPQPQFPVRARFSELRDVGASFDLQVTEVM